MAYFSPRWTTLTVWLFCQPVRPLGICRLSHVAFLPCLSIGIISARSPQLCWSLIRVEVMKSPYPLPLHCPPCSVILFLTTLNFERQHSMWLALLFNALRWRRLWCGIIVLVMLRLSVGFWILEFSQLNSCWIWLDNDGCCMRYSSFRTESLCISLSEVDNSWKVIWRG